MKSRIRNTITFAIVLFVLVGLSGKVVFANEDGVMTLEEGAQYDKQTKYEKGIEQEKEKR